MSRTIMSTIDKTINNVYHKYTLGIIVIYEKFSRAMIGSCPITAISYLTSHGVTCVAVMVLVIFLKRCIVHNAE